MNPIKELLQIKVYESNVRGLLQRLREIETERKNKGSDIDSNFSTLIGLIGLYHKHFEVVIYVAEEPSVDRKKLCLKFKDLSQEFLMKIANHKICWKFLNIAAAKFDSILQKEFKLILDNFYYYGETELCKYYRSRVVLLVIPPYVRYPSSSKS
jgi:hypothetical protein